VGCVTIHDTKDIVAVLREVTYTSSLTLPQEWWVGVWWHTN